ncbi:hypothetical protein AYI69_g1632 [Smittium culicis]|uniref:Uncharacterized protein n=1 Tax=Smittium culicis TaxID=133412 RepID=A0A1R1YPS1_9FUNG|nr:hypothetical protein AYI69_g1632 [Smittium culicis]
MKNNKRRSQLVSGYPLLNFSQEIQANIENNKTHCPNPNSREIASNQSSTNIQPANSLDIILTPNKAHLNDKSASSFKKFPVQGIQNSLSQILGSKNDSAKVENEKVGVDLAEQNHTFRSDNASDISVTAELNSNKCLNSDKKSKKIPNTIFKNLQSSDQDLIDYHERKIATNFDVLKVSDSFVFDRVHTRVNNTQTSQEPHDISKNAPKKVSKNLITKLLGIKLPKETEGRARVKSSNKLNKPNYSMYSQDLQNDNFIFQKNIRKKKRTVCCIPVRIFVAILFATIVLGIVLGFVLWPRVPTITAYQVTPLSAAQVTYNETESRYGLEIDTQIKYMASSGSFFRSDIKKIQTRVLSGVSNKVLYLGNTKKFSVAAQSEYSFVQNATLRFSSSFPNDQTVYDLFRKCAPSNATVLPSGFLTRTGEMLVNIESIVELEGYKLFWAKPKVVNSLFLNCPK